VGGLCLSVPAVATRAQPVLGFNGGNALPRERKALGIPGGAKVVMVVPNCPAGAHLQRGDIITELNGSPITSFPEFLRVLNMGVAPGDAVNVVFYRAGTRQQATMVAALRTIRGCQTVAATGIAPASASATGAYASPYLADGTLADWTAQLTGAQLGADLAGAAAGKLAEKATSQLTSQVPFGGLLAGAASSAAKKGVASSVDNMAKKNFRADKWFNTTCELSTHLHQGYSQRPDYVTALQMVFQAYPDVQQGHQTCVVATTVPAMVTAPATVVAPDSLPAAPAGPVPDLAVQLEKLAGLHQAGMLTDEEFAAAKKQLLDAL
jgi:hypothetical protein